MTASPQNRPGVLLDQQTDRGGKAQPMLIARGLQRYFPIRGGILNRRVAEVKAVDGVSFTVLKGETLGVVGESGCGKSTLARLLMHLLTRDAGELVFRILRVACWPISAPMADCLFTAVSTDTGSFQYSTTKPVTYHTAGELVRLGAHVETICHEVYQSFSLSRVRLLKHLNNHFHLAHNDQIAYLWLKQKDFARTGADRSDTEGLIDHIRAIEPVVVAVIFEEVGPDSTRLSLRSKSPRIDVNEIAGQFGGGGHIAAAGARIPGKPLSVQRRVIAAIKKALDSAPK